MRRLASIGLCLIAGCLGSHAPAVSDPADAGGTPRGGWELIVIHQSGEREGISATNAPVRYHWLVGNGRGPGDGAVVATEAWSRQWHDPTKSERRIDICLVGDFAHEPPTAAQMASCARLVADLRGRFGIDDRHVFAHSQLKPVECPGRFCDVASIRRASSDRVDRKPTGG